MLAVAIAVPFIVRAIRARRADIEGEFDDLSAEPGVATTAGEMPPRRFRRARGTQQPPF